MQAFANVALPDSYGSSGDFYSQKGVAVFVSIFNNTAAFRILQHDPARTSEIQELQEQASAPGSFLIEGGAGIRMRNNVAGSVARVFVTVFEPTDPRIAGFNPTSVTISASGTTSPVTGVSVLAYQQFVAPVTVTVTSEATAVPVVDAGALTFDGSTLALIEFYSPQITTQPAGNTTITAVLYDDPGSGAASVGLLGRSVLAVNEAVPWRLAVRLTPTSGSHRYSVRFFCGATGGVVGAGAGGLGQFEPGFIRIISGG